MGTIKTSFQNQIESALGNHFPMPTKQPSALMGVIFDWALYLIGRYM